MSPCLVCSTPTAGRAKKRKPARESANGADHWHHRSRWKRSDGALPWFRLPCGRRHTPHQLSRRGRDLGWMTTVGFAQLVRIMIDANMALVDWERERMRSDGQLMASRKQP